MYAGYVREVKTVLADVLDMSCEDDQVNMNTLCSAYDFIHVDDDRVFFENVSPMADTKNVLRDSLTSKATTPGSP